MASSPDGAVSEDVLKDILDELDRERSRRAELEEKIRKLEDEKSVLEDSQRVQDERTRDAESLKVSYHSYLAMEAKVEGFQQIVDTLTMGKPAIAAAAEAEQKQNATNTTFPMHIVRLLEVVPWDPRAKPHILREETIVEWQVYRDDGWKGQLGLFPPMLRTLRVATEVQGDATPSDQNHLRSFLANVERQARGKAKKLDRVLTNESVTMLYETDAGYALPADFGSWQWAGGWRVQKNSTADDSFGEPNAQSNNDDVCDENGWSYAKKPQDFVKSELVESTSGSTGSSPLRLYRRRYWTRKRVLIDYPFASEATKQYLKLVAETTSLAFAADKFNDQLVETKTALTETERQLVEAKSEANKSQHHVFDQVVEMKEKEMREPEMGHDSSRSKTSDTTKSPDTIKSSLDLGGKLSQWVQATRKTSEDMTVSDESMEGEGSISVGSSHGSIATEHSTSNNDKFDWKRFSTKTMQKWKPPVRPTHFNIQGNPLFRKVVSDPASMDNDDDDEL